MAVGHCNNVSFYKYLVCFYFYSINESALVLQSGPYTDLKTLSTKNAILLRFSNGLNNVYLILHLVNKQNLLL